MRRGRSLVVLHLSTYCMTEARFMLILGQRTNGTSAFGMAELAQGVLQ
jgi:hypothetical protein